MGNSSPIGLSKLVEKKRYYNDINKLICMINESNLLSSY